MKLSCVQNSSNRRFARDYIKANNKSNKKKKLEANQSFHQLLENEQNKLDSLEQ